MDTIVISKKVVRRIFYFLLIAAVIIYLFWPSGSNEKSEEEITVFDIPVVTKPVVEDGFPDVDTLHWAHIPITYKFEDSGTERQVNLTNSAFKRIENETSGVVKFQEVNENPDISIYFKPSNYRPGSSGDLRVADALISEKDESRNLILKGELNFYGQGFVCNTGYPALEVHEILHLFDIPHNPLINSIMSPYTAESSSTCKIKKIDDEYISCLKWIYSNGRIAGNCNFPNVVKEESNLGQSVCDNGWYPVTGTEYCCPKPNMKIIGGYCES